MDLDEEEYKAIRNLNGADKDIQVGDYVRCKNGKIAKVKDINEDYIYFDKEIYWQDSIPIFELDTGFIDFIIKHSPKPIDLIEKGDYVNGRLVLQVDYKNKNVCLLIPLTDTKVNTNIMWYGYEDIKTIVTHEQFNSVMYKVEEDKQYVKNKR